MNGGVSNEPVPVLRITQRQKCSSFFKVIM